MDIATLGPTPDTDIRCRKRLFSSREWKPNSLRDIIYFGLIQIRIE